MSENLNLEAALQELEEIAQRLESGDLTMDESLSLFERGQRLIQQCQQDLDEKELRIQQIMGDDSLSPLNP
jgi:exodeoxyribonuclease VII small subunit